MTRIPPFPLDPTLVECPICAVPIKHSSLGRHAMASHEQEIEARLSNPNDRIIAELRDLGFTFKQVPS